MRSAILGDKAFITPAARDVISTPLKKNLIIPLGPDGERWRRWSAWIVSRRQMIEWGVHALVGLWTRLATRLPCDDVAWNLIIEACLLLNNFRVVYDGGNQITSTYHEVIEESVNELASDGLVGQRADGTAYIGEPEDDDMIAYDPDN